jgi:hypothetical protein
MGQAAILRDSSRVPGPVRICETGSGDLYWSMFFRSIFQPLSVQSLHEAP